MDDLHRPLLPLSANERDDARLETVRDRLNAIRMRQLGDLAVASGNHSGGKAARRAELAFKRHEGRRELFDRRAKAALGIL